MQALRADHVRSLHARLAGILADEGDAISVRVDGGFARVTAMAGGQQFRFEIDLRDPDAELVLAAKLACFLERVKHAPCQ